MIKFIDIKNDNVAIEFNNSEELTKLVKYLRSYRYEYGTNGGDLNEIEFLGVEYFGNSKFLSLDRSRKHHSVNYVSCGKGYKDVCYKFKEINWNIMN